MGYKISKEFALSGSEGSSQKAKKNVIILHDVGNLGTNGRNNASYMSRTWNNAYTHFVIDGDTAYQVGEPAYVAWGALDWGNRNAVVQIEIDNSTDKAHFKKSYTTYINLTRDMAKKYDIDLDLDLNNNYGIKTHKWVSDNKAGDHQDPYAYLAKMGISKAQLAKDLKNGIKEDKVEKVDSYWRRKGNHFNLYELTTDLNVYNDNKLTKKRRVKLGKGTRVYATDICYAGVRVTRLKVANGWISGNTKFMKRIKY